MQPKPREIQVDRRTRSVTSAGELVLVALGGNLAGPFGPPEETIRAAIKEIAAEIAPVAAASPLYRTPCFPAGAGPDYVNAAVRLEGGGDPAALLAALHAVEARHGRARKQRWGMRTLDLDLLAVGDLVMPDPATQAAWRALPPDLQQMRSPDALILPHPRLQDRAFVLVPLADVAPEWVHPLLGLSVTAMRDLLPSSERDEVRVLDHPEA
jgi:2-amino-4-hydroxy-6-hydroxymethyldihydropteridine diphosphokinase